MNETDLDDFIGDAEPSFGWWWLEDLDAKDRAAFRRFYRILRIAVYANQEYTGPDRTCYQGCYGLDRASAKQYVLQFASDIAWHNYLGSK